MPMDNQWINQMLGRQTVQLTGMMMKQLKTLIKIKFKSYIEDYLDQGYD